jgi:hypothetical protein
MTATFPEEVLPPALPSLLLAPPVAVVLVVGTVGEDVETGVGIGVGLTDGFDVGTEV